MRILNFFTSLSALYLCTCKVHATQPVFRLPRDVAGSGHYIAVLKDNTSHETLMEVVERLRSIEGCVVYRYMERILKAVVLEISNDALDKVRSFSEIAYIEEEGILRAATNSRVIAGNTLDLWYQSRIAQLPGDGDGVDVYILDSGIRFEHEQFGGRAKYGGYDAVDQYEFSKGTHDYVPMRGRDCHGHGTAVASLVGGTHFGKATTANLYSIRVLRCDTTAPWSIVLDGLEYVSEMVPKRGQNAIVVLALSGINTNAMNDAISVLNGQAVIVVAAAGNDGMDACSTSPASSPNVITVGSTDRNDNIASFSNYGPCLDLFAPGQDILAANNECDTCTGTMSGTTLSAALTAGVVAAYFSQLPHFTPALMKERILHQCVQNAVNLASLPTGARTRTQNLLLNRGCGGTIRVDNKTGILQSPEFPLKYLSNTRCKWTLVADRPFNYIKLDFIQIILEEGYDYLTICPKSVCNNNEIIKITGDYGAPDCTIYSDEKYMTLEMSSDGFLQGQGFQASYIAHSVEEIKGSKPNECNKNSDSSILLDVYSAAYSVGNRFWMHKHWQEFFAGRKDGINIAVVDEVNGSIISTNNFNQANGHSAQLGRFVEQIHPGRIVCVAVSKNGANQLSEFARRSLRWLGSERINHLTGTDSWALIGVKGNYVPHYHAVEMSGSLPAEVYAKVHLKSSYQQHFEITAVSGGLRYSEHAMITLNGTQIDIPYVGHDRGLHVMVVDDVTLTVIHTEVFDTAAESSAYSSSSRFAELINAQPKGRIVAIAIKEEAMAHMSEEAKQACVSIGSAMIRSVQHGNSWAIVGRKGARIGSVPESTTYSGDSVARLVESPDKKRELWCTIQVSHSGRNDGLGSSITINGTTITSSTRGNFIALLKDDECAIERNITSSSSDALYNFITPLPSGRRVVVILAWDYKSLSDYGVAALESIGSARIRYTYTYGPAWAVIGEKGATMGTVVEDARHIQNSKTLQTTISIRKVSGYVTIQSAGSNTGDYSKIKVGNTLFTIPSEYENGLNMVVFEGNTMNVWKNYTYNMTYSNNSQDIANFIRTTRNLTDGTVVALASNNAGALNTVEEVRVVVEGLGSQYINQTSDGSCWGMIGRKGAEQGQVPEVASDSGPVEMITHSLAGASVEDGHCNIMVEATGTGDMGGIKININGKYYENQTSRENVFVALVEEGSCKIESITPHYTWYNKQGIDHLAAVLKKLPVNKTVIVSIFAPKTYSQPTYSSVLDNALELIGSSMFRRARYRDTWAIIGRKGAPMGSVPEALMNQSGTKMKPVVSLSGLVKIGKNQLKDCEKTIFPLDCLERKG